MRDSAILLEVDIQPAIKLTFISLQLAPTISSPVWLKVLGNHRSWLNDSGFLRQLSSRKGLYPISRYLIGMYSSRLAVASEFSPIFLPTNLLLHSSVLLLSLDVIPGTTRGILRFGLYLKVLLLRILICGWYLEEV
jgi:hypothetical protein